MSREEPRDNKLERGGDDESLAFHKKAPLIKNLGDGVQAFVGLIAGVSSLHDTIILIDEPEAFLSAPIARRLGAALAQIANTRKATLIIATHSPDFVMGCLESTEDINLVRLTYEDEIATAAKLEAAKIKELFKQPILRSTGVIQSLFHPAVIITEGDSDRIVYEEINRQLMEQNEHSKDVLFLKTSGKSSIYKIIKPLRELGIPAVAIVDLDFIKSEHQKDWDNLIKACQIDAININSKRKQVLEIFFKNTRVSEPIKNGGINNLTDQDKKIAEDFLDELALYGLYVVPIGEVEDWGEEIGIKKPSDKNSKLKGEWPEQFLTKITKSSNKGIGIFLKKIASWVNNPDRKGIREILQKVPPQNELS
jgi:predicted ATP-dependent endonuclease of OLD family